jgi:class 3 adenylate cyclase
MSLIEELTERASDIFSSQWDARDGQVVPDPDDVTLGNEAVEFEEAAILYADLSGSTVMVDTKKWTFAAEVYKAYLYAAARIIRDCDGEITAYDGDRIMAVFLGDSKNSNAAITALKINWAVRNILNPEMLKVYSTPFRIKQVTGVDLSRVRAARTGVRGDNDLVWVGSAANHAAKLSSSGIGYSSIVTERCYRRLRKDVKFSGNRPIWTKVTDPSTGQVVYGSSWSWKI